MNLPQNPFKAALARGECQLGLWIALADGYCAEVSAGAGFDWLLIDGEHAPNDIRSILQQLQAVAPYATHPVVRPPVGATHIIKQLLDIGAQTLLVPMVETAQEAEALVAAVRYPPAGVRGVGSSLARASRWNLVPGYLGAAEREICLLVQVESKRGLENIDAIAAVPGIDGVFIGPADLAGALGHLGEMSHPEVIAAIEHGAARIIAAGKAPGILAGDEASARRALALGYRFVAVGSDVGLLARSTRGLAASARQWAEEEQKRRAP